VRSQRPLRFSSPNALRQTLIHHPESDLVGTGVEECLEPFELAQYVKNAGQMLDRAAWLTLFQSPHRVDRNAASLGQRGLRETAPAAGEREVPAELSDGVAWLRVYWVIAATCIVAMTLLGCSRLDESATRGKAQPVRASLAQISGSALRPMAYVFLASRFFYGLIEQSFGTWRPTFNNEVLKLPDAIAVQMASMLAASIAVGRIAAGQLLRRVAWYPLLNIRIVGMALLMIVTLPLARGISGGRLGWLHAPLAAYLILLIGLLMAPIYPVINSVASSALPKPAHATMTGLILVFSALGGTLGSCITAIVFARFGGIHAFYFSLVPMALLLVTLFLFKRETRRAAAALPALDAPAR